MLLSLMWCVLAHRAKRREVARSVRAVLSRARLVGMQGRWQSAPSWVGVAGVLAACGSGVDISPPENSTPTADVEEGPPSFAATDEERASTPTGSSVPKTELDSVSEPDASIASDNGLRRMDAGETFECDDCSQTTESSPDVVDSADHPTCGEYPVLGVARFLVSVSLREAEDTWFIWPGLDVRRGSYVAELVSGEVLPPWLTVSASTVGHVLLEISDAAPVTGQASASALLIEPGSGCPLAHVPFEIYLVE